MPKRVEVSSRPKAMIDIKGLNVLTTAEAFNPTGGHVQGLVGQRNCSVKDSIRGWKAESGRQEWSVALPKICWSMNATWHSAIKTTPYELVFGRKFNWRNHLDHHQRIAYTLEDGATPLGEIDGDVMPL